MKTSNIARDVVLLGVLSFVWLVIDGLLIPPDFGQIDIYYFKDAGINFAEGLGLKSRFTYGNPTFDYRDFSVYPPLYPLCFGVFAKLLGVSAATNQLFNVLVSIILGLLGFVTLKPAVVLLQTRRSVSWPVPVLAVTCIVMGYFGLAADRPDGLGAALGIGAIGMALRGRTFRAHLTSGALAALALFTSPFAGLMTCLCILIGVIGILPRATSPRMSLRMFAIALGGAVAGGLTLATIAIGLPGWFHTFFGVASGADTHNETGGGYFIALLHGDIQTWLGGFPYSTIRSLVPVMRLAAVEGAIAVALLSPGAAATDRTYRISLFALALITPLCLVTSPYQSNYPPIAAALVLATWAVLETRSTRQPRRVAILGILLAFAACVALDAPSESRNLLLRAGTRASATRELQFLQARHALLETSGRLSAAAPANYILWRQAGLHPLINIFSGFEDPVRRRSIQFLALSYRDSGDLRRPLGADSVSPDEYLLVREPVLPQAAMVLGHRVSGSSQTWEDAIFARRDCRECMSETRADGGTH